MECRRCEFDCYSKNSALLIGNSYQSESQWGQMQCLRYQPGCWTWLALGIHRQRPKRTHSGSIILATSLQLPSHSVIGIQLSTSLSKVISRSLILLGHLTPPTGQGRTATVPALSSKLTPLTEQLITDLLGALVDPAQRRSSTIKLVAYIVRLGPDALVRARDSFLNARSTLMRKRVRAIRFEGDVRAYVKELSLVVFTSIKHTADWYLASFRDIEMASGERCLTNVYSHANTSLFGRAGSLGERASRGFCQDVLYAGIRHRIQQLPTRTGRRRYNRPRMYAHNQNSKSTRKSPPISAHLF